MPTQLAFWSNTDASGAPLAASARANRATLVPACDIRRVLAVVPRAGASLRIHLLSNYSIAAIAGWRFTVVGPADGSLDALRESLRDVPRTEYIGAPVKGGDCRMGPVVRSLLRDGGFDLIHSHGLTTTVHTIVANFGRGVPHIATLHESVRMDEAPSLLGRLRRWGLGWLLRRPDALIVAGEDARTDLLECFPPLVRRPGRVVTIPNGVPMRRPADGSAGAGSLRRRLGAETDASVIAYVAGSTQDAGFPVLLDAVRRLATDTTAPPFHVAAFCPNGRRDESQREVERRGLSDRVTLLDLAADLSAVLRQLDLVVAPSPSEDGARAAMEAMAAGLPVLGADAPGLRELLRGTPSRTVAVGDADALRYGLHIALCRPWSEAARAFAPAARVRFDCTRSARRLLECFDQLTGNGSAKPPTSLAA